MKRGVTRDGDDAGVNCVGMDVSTLGGYFEYCSNVFWLIIFIDKFLR